MLELERAQVFYGGAQALFDVSMAIEPGEVVALVGRNGAGKSTALKALAGWEPLREGTIRWNGSPLRAVSAEQMSRLGIALVPDSRQVFPLLSVEENLRMSSVAHKASRWTIESAFSLFPRLAERRTAAGAALSGGEQQMLAIARALLCQPAVLLLDEPTEGLSPLMAQAVVEAIRTIASEQIGIVIVEQNARIPLQLARLFYVLDSGCVAWKGNREAFLRDEDKVNRLMSV